MTSLLHSSLKVRCDKPLRYHLPAALNVRHDKPCGLT